MVSVKLDLKDQNVMDWSNIILSEKKKNKLLLGRINIMAFEANP